MSSPEISVIIPTYRSWSDLGLCLAALRAQTLRGDAFEVIVVNNDPDDPPPDGFELGPALLLDERAPGSYAARNRGLAVARGQVFAFTDSDCVPEPEWLERIRGHFKSESEHARVGGRIRVLEDPKAEPLAQLHDRHFALRQEAYVRHGWAATANMAARRDVFDRIGGFDATQMSSGDSLWGRAAAAEDIPIAYLAEAVVGHPPRRTVAAIIRKTRRTSGGKVEIRKRRRNLTGLRLDYILRTPLRLLPRVSVFRRVSETKGLTFNDGVRMVLLLHRLKWVEWAERGRLLFTSGDAKRE
ncbi:MAG: glycosyltransferase [Pseudomonadota bacterium]